MRVLMIGPPGAGKGTQGARIARHFHIPHIATGEVLRDHVSRGTAIGRAAQGHLDRGELVPDSLLFNAVRGAFAAGGFVLDGMPRTLDQARSLERLGMTADVAVHLHADDEELTRRLLARGASGGRSDDVEPVIRERLRRYHELAAPLTAWYRLRGMLVSLDATRPAHLVGRDVLAALT
ncbi:nucleoside monophosphate kinase [Dactylosporangium sp. NPDC005572]|uniref:adenylate kinase family protein n=1 Tax=Dactylosporangium sp. NPDC005572 TaxID=3156889 RepID=UPI00339EA39D